MPGIGGLEAAVDARVDAQVADRIVDQRLQRRPATEPLVQAGWGGLRCGCGAAGQPDACEQGEGCVKQKWILRRSLDAKAVEA